MRGDRGVSGDSLEAIVLVGGQGTRLRPLTLSTPKPLLPVGGAPLIAHQLARIGAAGVRHVVLATSYRAEMFDDYVRAGAAYGVELDCVAEEQPLGTGGGIRGASDRLRSAPGEPVLVMNGDILSGHDLAGQVALHRSTGADVTLQLTEVSDPRAYGCVPSDATGRVAAFHEKSPDPVTNRVNAGCYVFTREVLSRIPPGRAVSIERETFPAMLSEGGVLMAYADGAYWLDLGTPEAYIRGSRDLVLGRLESFVLPGPTGQTLVLDGAGVAPDADVCGGTTVGAGASVGPNAVVDGSVLMEGSVVGEDAVVRRSVLAEGVRVAAGAVLDGVTVGAKAVVGEGNELRVGARVWPGVELPPGAIRFSGGD